jgi:uncharacterized membrane protein YhiD involved in acid resistance
MNFSPDTIFVFQLSPIEIMVHLLVALICGTIISLLYRATYRGVNYSANYVVSIIMLTMITALVIMVIGNNLARAFGLVGAMSIIRFRTAVKDTQDIMFIFFALAIGLACGAGMFMIAMVGTFFIGLSVLFSVFINSENPHKKAYLLQVYSQNLTMDSDELQKVINPLCSSVDLVNIKTIGEPDRQVLELSFYVKLKKVSNGPKLITQTRSIPHVTKVNLFYDEV